MQLRNRATKAGMLIGKSRKRDTDAAGYGLYALVVPDSEGRGSDPRGENAAAAAFEDGDGMTLDEIAKELGAL